MDYLFDFLSNGMAKKEIQILDKHKKTTTMAYDSQRFDSQYGGIKILHNYQEELYFEFTLKY